MPTVTIGKMNSPVPTLIPLGDSALLVRFATRLDQVANALVVVLATRLQAHPPSGTLEIVPNLTSVLLRYDPRVLTLDQLQGEVRLLLATPTTPAETGDTKPFSITVAFGGDQGPDLDEVAAKLSMSSAKFIAAHNASSLRVLATGFAPGFIYCGLHDEALHLPRRHEVRAKVPAGTVLFAAGQTAITATAIPTGWHVIGHTDFNNFDPAKTPATQLRAGDRICFEVAK